MRSHIITSEHEINYCDLVVLKPVTFSRTTQEISIENKLQRLYKFNNTLLTGNTGINYGSYSYL